MLSLKRKQLFIVPQEPTRSITSALVVAFSVSCHEPPEVKLLAVKPTHPPTPSLCVVAEAVQVTVGLVVELEVEGVTKHLSSGGPVRLSKI